MKKNYLRKIVTAIIAATTMTSFSSLGVSAATTNSEVNNYYNAIANELLKTGLIMNNGEPIYSDKVATTTNNMSTATDSNNNQVTTNTDNITKTGATNNTPKNVTSADVQGLPKLPTKYAINVQAGSETKILQLMNEKRVEAGLKPLTMDNTLVQIARYKSNHMIQYNYFDHITPEGTKWTSWLQAIGYKYTTTGENIAYNTNDPVELFNQWWNSPGHRANMMNASYTKVGIGVLQGNGKYMGTQTFAN